MKISVITPSIRPEFLNITQECLERQTFQDFEWNVALGLRNRGNTLSSDWNKLIKQSKGEIIVMLQDCIKIEDDFLEKVVEKFNPKIGFTYPLGKVMNFLEAPKWDWRHHWLKDNKNPIDYSRWEIDLASCSKQLFYDVGGFDEDYNNGWSWENVEIACRATFAGYSFAVDDRMSGIALDHDAIQEHPTRNKMENNDKRSEQTRISAINGEWKLNYLNT